MHLPYHFRQLSLRRSFQTILIYRSPCLVKLPTGIASAKERLRLCHEFYTKMRRSSQPASNFYLKYLLGLLPYKYSQAISRFRLWTGNVTSLPGPLEYMSIAEHPIEDMYFSSASDSGKRHTIKLCSI